MKDKNLNFKKFGKKLERNFKPSVKNLHGPKSSFFFLHEYMDEKIMSRVLVGFDKTTDFRGRTPDGDGHGFFERLPHKSPFGAIINTFDELRVHHIHCNNIIFRMVS